MVFHIAGKILGGVVDVRRIAADRLRLLFAFEGLDDRRVRFAQNVREHVEPTAVRHPDHDFARPGAGSRVHDLVEHRDDHVVALDREAFLTEIGLMQEALEAFDLRQAAEQGAAGCCRQWRGELAGFDGVLQPESLRGFLDVIEVVANRPGVHLSQLLHGRRGIGCAVGRGTADNRGRQPCQIRVG